MVSIVSNTPSLASKSAENGLSLLIPMVLLVVGSAVAALFVIEGQTFENISGFINSCFNTRPDAIEA